MIVTAHNSSGPLQKTYGDSAYVGYLDFNINFFGMSNEG